MTHFTGNKLKLNIVTFQPTNVLNGSLWEWWRNQASRWYEVMRQNANNARTGWNIRFMLLELCFILVWIIQAGDAFIIWYRFGSVIGIVALASFVSYFFLFPRVLFFVNQIAYSFRAFALWFYLQWKHYHSICNNSHWTNGIRWIKWLASIERCHRMSNTYRYYRSIRNACCTQVLSMWKCIE